MTTTAGPDGGRSTEVDWLNAVSLRGRVSGQPTRRELPSGDVLWSFRLVVPRPPGGRSRQRVDALECAAWSARARRSVAAWREGDLVSVTGSLRRRFFRGVDGSASRVEVEMASGRIIRRAGSA